MFLESKHLGRKRQGRKHFPEEEEATFQLANAKRLEFQFTVNLDNTIRLRRPDAHTSPPAMRIAWLNQITFTGRMYEPTNETEA